jgi:hypothetical protein
VQASLPDLWIHAAKLRLSDAKGTHNRFSRRISSDRRDSAFHTKGDADLPRRRRTKCKPTPRIPLNWMSKISEPSEQRTCALWKAAYAIFSPPRSAMFSPCVNSPFSLAPYTEYPENWSTITLARRLNSSASSGVHQSVRLPSASKRRPWSSYPGQIRLGPIKARSLEYFD